MKKQACVRGHGHVGRMHVLPTHACSIGSGTHKCSFAIQTFFTPSIHFHLTGNLKSASSCDGTPTMGTSQPDDDGYLWGWVNVPDKACVWRNSNGKPIYYAALITGQPNHVALHAPDDSCIGKYKNALCA